MTKKLIIYEVNPMFYFDKDNKGVGSIKGLIDKISYFKYLNIDTLVLPNILNVYDDKKKFNYLNIHPGIGTLEDFIELNKEAKKNSLKIFIDINIATINENHDWFQKIVSKNEVEKKVTNQDNLRFNNKTKSFYLVNDKTTEMKIDWNRNKEAQNKFLEVIRFWSKNGIAGFRFTNFEELISETGELTSEIQHELRDLYTSIKKINSDLLIIGSTAKEIKNFGSYANKNTRLFDYTQSKHISIIDLNEKYNTDVIGKFSVSKLYKNIKKISNSFQDIISFSSNLSGRIVSRWGDSETFNRESATAFATLLMLTRGSTLIYYGEEIGSTNIGLTRLDDFSDPTLQERQKKLQLNEKIKKEDFMDAQILQNPINSHSLMSWSEKKNGGFSNRETTIIPVSTNYKEINVMNQYNDNFSTLNLYKKLINLTKDEKLLDLFTNGTFKIKLLGNILLKREIIQIQWTNVDHRITAIINLSKKQKKFSFEKYNGELIFGNYKNYDVKNKTLLNEYEAVILHEKFDSISYTNKIGELTATVELRNEIRDNNLENVEKDTSYTLPNDHIKKV
ncbi:MAG: alpha-amylase family glycosyl hydrolase [Mycoplasma sp.]|nr:alpha-amylase family glycosyl hydrolase [Mycoplasma sp.]